MKSSPSFQNTFNLTRPTIANFADIIKTATMLIKITIKYSKTIEIIRN